jgi:hypothetical protein
MVFLISILIGFWITGASDLFLSAASQKPPRSSLKQVPEDPFLPRLRQFTESLRSHQERLSRDPADFLHNMALLPEAEPLLRDLTQAYTRGKLTPRCLMSLRRVDERLRGLDLPPLFLGLRSPSDTSQEAAWLPRKIPFQNPSLRMPETVRGYLAEAVRSLRRARTLEAQFRTALESKRGTYPESFSPPPELQAQAFGGFLESRDQLKLALYRKASRVAMQTWLRNLTDATRRMLFFCALSLREEPETEHLVPELLLHVSRERTLVLPWYSPVVFSSVPFLLPALPKRPACQLFAGLLLATGRDARKGARVENTGPWQEASRKFFSRALLSLQNSPIQKLTLLRAVHYLHRYFVRRDLCEEARTLYRRYRTLILTSDNVNLSTGTLLNLCHCEEPGTKFDPLTFKKLKEFSLLGKKDNQDWPCLH